MLINDNTGGKQSNNSIANEWGQWRYFNSALKQLGTQKAAKINISVKEQPIEEEVNWMGALGAVAEGIAGGFEARKKAAMEVAEDYVKHHSYQEYIDELNKGGVPLQDDPIGNREIARKYGIIAFSAVEQEFSDMVNQGAFVHMEPEQVDAAHYDFVRKRLSEFGEKAKMDVNDFGGFLEGFYENSGKARVEQMTANVVQKDAWKRQQQNHVSLVETNSLIRGGDIEGAISKVETNLMKMRNPEDIKNYLEGVLSFAGNTEHGWKFIEAVRNRTFDIFGVPTKLDDYLGDETFESLHTKSLNVGIQDKADELFNVTSMVDSWATKGDEASILAYLNTHLANNGNQKDKIYDLCVKAYASAKRVNASNASAEAKNYLYSVGSQEVRQWIQDRVAGKPTISREALNLKLKGTGVVADDIRVATQQALAAGLQSESPEVVSRSLELIASPDPDDKLFREAGAGVINGLVNSAAMSLDAIERNGVGADTRGLVEHDFGDGRKVRVPRDANAILKIMNANKAAFGLIINASMYDDTGLDGDSDAIKLMTLNNIIASGDPDPLATYADVRTGVKEIKEKIKENGHRAQPNFSKLAQTVGVPDNPMLRMAYYKTYGKAINEGAMKPQEAIKNFKEFYVDSNYINNQLVIPKTMFTNVFKDVKDERLRKSLHMEEYIDTAIADISKSMGFKDPSAITQYSMYDAHTGNIIVKLDPYSNYGVIRQSDLVKKVKEIYESSTDFKSRIEARNEATRLANKFFSVDSLDNKTGLGD